MIDIEYCDYRESKLLREVGYNEPCDTFYEDMVMHDGEEISYEEELDLKSEGRAREIRRKRGGNVGQHYNQNSDFLRSHLCSRPTLSQALRWLRETRHYHIEAYPSKEGAWHVWIVCLGSINEEDGKLNACDMDGKEYPTYEAALHAALVFQLKNLSNALKYLLKNFKEGGKDGEGKRN